MIDDCVVGGEDAVREPIVAQELPDVFLRVQLGALWRQRHDGDVAGDVELRGHMPTRLVEQQRCMAPGCHLVGDGP